MTTDPVGDISAPPLQGSVLRVWPSFVGAGIALVFPIATVVGTGPRSHPSIEGTGIATLAALVCIYGMFCGRRRPLWAKVIAVCALLFTGAVAGWCLYAYVSFGRGN